MKPTEIGKKVQLEGIAQNGKSGAILLNDELGPVYLEGLMSFPDSVIGKAIEASGLLQTIEHDGAALQNEKGEWSQGMSGKQMILQKPHWKQKE